MSCPKCESKFLSKIDNDNYICEDCRNKFTKEFIAMVNQRRFMHEQLEKMSEPNSQTLSIYEVPKGYFTEKKQSLLEAIEMEHGKKKLSYPYNRTKVGLLYIIVIQM